MQEMRSKELFVEIAQILCGFKQVQLLSSSVVGTSSAL